MTKVGRRSNGLTVIEVLIAIVILAVGVLGAFGLQGAALRGTRVAMTAQELANIARSELQIQSEFRRTTGSVISGESCRTTSIGQGYACTVIVYPCSGTASSVTCVSNNVTGVVAHQVVVSVTGADGRTVTLATLVKGS